jgi:hypothetical protein
VAAPSVAAPSVAAPSVAAPSAAAPSAAAPSVEAPSTRPKTARRLASLALAAACALAAPATADDHDVLPPYDPAHPVEVPPVGPFYGLRLTGLAGAFTAVAEGTEGMLSSLASLANRRPNKAGFFDWDAAFSWVVPAAYLDVGNNGRGAPAGFSLLAGGATLRFGRYGLGFFVESVGLSDLGEGTREVRMNRAVVGVAHALPGDDWVAGIGLHSVGYHLQIPDGPVVEGGGVTLGTDLLWRPLGEPYRLGLSVKLPARARLPDDVDTSVPSAVVRPWEISVGGAWWLGDGELNVAMPVTDEMEAREPARTGLLVSLDLFLIGPTSRRGPPSAGLEAYFEDLLQITGERATLGVRLGGETEAYPDRVRLRGGFWVEPSRFAEVGPRLHWTGGLDIFVAEVFGYRWRVSGAFDLAADYRVASLSAGFW